MSKAQVNIQTAISFLQQITGRNNLLTSPQTQPQHQVQTIIQPQPQTQSKPKPKQSPSPFKHPKHFIPPSLASPISKHPQRYPSKLSSPLNKQGQTFAFSKFNQTADIIQSTLVKFYQNDQDIYHNIQRSSQTRLNIYYRQNARILKQIRVQNEIVRSNNEGNIEEKEAKLNKEFMFTVKDDCRDHIQMCITKAQQKLSKMIEDEATFKLALVVMVDNELKVYRDCTETKLLKVIRMYEIEHISYNEQPVKCIVVSFVKDKSKPAEHLYLKFDNNQDHDKWDRIIFINRKLYKMEIKQNLFEAEYEKGAKEKHFKKVGKEEKREVDVNGTLKILIEEEAKMKERSKLEQIMREREKEKERELLERSIKDKQYKDLDSNKDDERSNMLRDKQYNRDREMTFKQYSVHGGKQIQQQRSREDIRQIQVQQITDNMTRSLLNPTARQLFSSPEAPYNRSNSNQFINMGSYTSPQIRIDLVDSLPPNTNPPPNSNLFNSPSFLNEQGNIEPSIRVIQKSEVIIQQPHSSFERQREAPKYESKLQRLQKQFDKGLYATKINLFRDSKKIIFLKQNSFIYYNEEEYRNWMISKKNKKNKDQMKEPEKKEIKILSIDKMDRRKDLIDEKGEIDKKKMKDKKDKLTLLLSSGKKFEIEAPDLSPFADWLKLKLNELIREE